MILTSATCPVFWLQASSLTRSALANPLASHNVRAGSFKIISNTRSFASAADKKEYDLVVIGGGES